MCGVHYKGLNNNAHNFGPSKLDLEAQFLLVSVKESSSME